jgi:S1-C subfamily serine protease
LDRSRGAALRLESIEPTHAPPPHATTSVRPGEQIASGTRWVGPWLGFYAAEIEDRIVVIGVADRGPAQKAGLQAGDVVQSVAGHEPTTLASLFRRIWSLGNAGVEVPMRIYRDGRTFEQRIVSSERSRFFKVPRMH